MRHQRIVVSHYGGPDQLGLVEGNAPEPQAGEVRVKVLAAGVAMPDVMALDGSLRAAVETVGTDLFTLVHKPEKGRLLSC